MHFSLFLTTRGHRADDDHRVIGAMVDHAKQAADLGFEAVFLPDHHFTGYAPPSSDSFMFAAYLAAQLPTMWFGFSIQTVPLHNPVRFAERVALLSHLTEGRLLVGVGSGTTPEESIGFGVDFRETAKVGNENLAIIERLWAKQPGDEPIEFDTGHYRGAVVSRISPAPYGDPMRQIMSVAARPASVERAVKHGQSAFVHNFAPPAQLHPEVPFDVFKEGYLRYRTALEAAGHEPAVVARALEWTTATWQYIHVAPTDEQANEELDLLLGQYQESIDQESLGNKAAERILGIDLPKQQSALSDEYRRVWCIAGSPDTVAARLQPYADLGVGNILGGFMGGPLTDERIRLTASSLDLFSREVMPRFQQDRA